MGRGTGAIAKLLMPPFHGAKVKAYADTICEITQEIASSWQPGSELLASEVMPEITLEVILQTVFGLREGDRYGQIKSLLVKLLDLTGSPLSASMIFFRWFQQDWGSWSPWGKVVRLRQQVYDLLQAEIDQRRAHADTTHSNTGENLEGDDVLSLLLLVRDEDGQPMSDIELKDELITMLMAGHETTATALTWAMYWIHKLPDVKAKLMAELESLGKNADSNGDRITPLPHRCRLRNPANLPDCPHRRAPHLDRNSHHQRSHLPAQYLPCAGYLLSPPPLRSLS